VDDSQQLLETFLQLLRSIRSPHCQRLLLDYLPFTFSSDEDSAKSQSLNFESVFCNVLEVLRLLLNQDSSLLDSILQCCISLSPASSSSSSSNTQLEIFRIALEFLSVATSKTSDQEHFLLSDCIQFLLCHVASQQEAQWAVSAIREAWHSFEGNDRFDNELRVGAFRRSSCCSSFEPGGAFLLARGVVFKAIRTFNRLLGYRYFRTGCIGESRKNQ
jgi:hypothetical protein